MKYIFFILLINTWGYAQLQKEKQKNSSDTLVVDNGQKDSVKIFKPTIYDYKYKNQHGEEKIFDTTFTVQKSYAYTQYNNRDNFGKIQFANIGSGFQNLVFSHNEEKNLSLLPDRKSHFVLGIQDIKYYDVKTPTTSFIYHTAMRNGAALQSTYTQNIGKNFNFALEYMGLRSQGFYTNSLAANNNTLFSAHFKSENSRYEAYTHYLHQNINNEEYGGISDLDIFLSGDSRFNNRANLGVNLNSSDSRFSYRRYYFSQIYTPFGTEKSAFKIRHTIFNQSNKYYLNLGATDISFFEATNLEREFGSKKYSKNLSNTISLLFDKEKFYLDAGLRHQNLKLGAENKVVNTDILAGNQYTENRIGVVGNLRINIAEQVALKSFLEFSRGNQFGNYLRSDNQLKFKILKDYFIDAKVNFQSAIPSFNLLVNASPIMNYNFNNINFNNENILELGGAIGLKWFNTQIFANYFRIDNYTYTDAYATPKQSANSLNISQIGGDITFSYKKFHLNTRLLFQSNLTEKDLFPTPNFIARSNLYWQSKAFKNATKIITGIKVLYFTKFASRDFSPILNEFILPNHTAYSIGGQPIIDAYFNFKVKTMQIFIEAQNLTTTFTQNKSYTAPYYPIYDFRLNIGIVWNLFH